MSNSDSSGDERNAKRNLFNAVYRNDYNNVEKILNNPKYLPLGKR